MLQWRTMNQLKIKTNNCIGWNKTLYKCIFTLNFTLLKTECQTNQWWREIS